MDVQSAAIDTAKYRVLGGYKDHNEWIYLDPANPGVLICGKKQVMATIQEADYQSPPLSIWISSGEEVVYKSPPSMPWWKQNTPQRSIEGPKPDHAGQAQSSEGPKPYHAVQERSTEGPKPDHAPRDESEGSNIENRNRDHPDETFDDAKSTKDEVMDNNEQEGNPPGLVLEPIRPPGDPLRIPGDEEVDYSPSNSKAGQLGQ